MQTLKTSTITLVQEEVACARKKHPTCYLAALMEEVGEASQAMMQHGSASKRAQEELVQVAATAIRLIEEPDPIHLVPVEEVALPFPPQRCQCPTCLGHRMAEYDNQ